MASLLCHPALKSTSTSIPAELFTKISVPEALALELHAPFTSASRSLDLLLIVCEKKGDGENIPDAVKDALSSGNFTARFTSTFPTFRKSSPNVSSGCEYAFKVIEASSLSI